MRLGHAQQSRLEWYDRTPVSRIIETSVLVAPHAEIVRATYTVPSAKKAYLEQSQVLVHRDTAATTVGRCAGLVKYNPTAGGTTTVMHHSFIANAVGDRQEGAIGGSALMFAGDAIEQRTIDDGTGGTVRYSIGNKVTEFDA